MMMMMMMMMTVMEMVKVPLRPPDHLFINPIINPFINPFVHPSINPIIHLLVRPSVRLSTQDAVATRFYQSDDGDQRSKMLKVDPWDYSHMLNVGNHDDDYHGNNESADDREEDGKTADADEAER